MENNFHFIFSTFRGNARLTVSSYTVYPDGKIMLNNATPVFDDFENLERENSPLSYKMTGNLCRMENGKIVQSWGGMKVKKICCLSNNEINLIFYPATEK